MASDGVPGASVRPTMIYDHRPLLLCALKCLPADCAAIQFVLCSLTSIVVNVHHCFHDCLTLLLTKFVSLKT